MLISLLMKALMKQNIMQRLLFCVRGDRALTPGRQFCIYITGREGIFLINIPIGIITFLLGLYGLSESADPEKAAFDPAGQLLSIAALGSVTYGLIEAGSRGWLHPVTLSAVIGGIILFLVFLVTENRVARPLLPLSDFKQRDYHQYNMASFVIGFSTYTNIFFIALFLQKAQAGMRWNALECAGSGMAYVAGVYCYGCVFIFLWPDLPHIQY